MATLDRPAVEYRTPTDLVRDVQRGIVRVPPFQRGFRWEPQDVAKLFDSLYRGYPIGNLLFWRHPAPAQSMTIGPVELQAPETEADAKFPALSRHFARRLDSLPICLE